MTKYSSTSIPVPVTADEFAKAKDKILVEHQKKLELLQQSIAPLEAQVTQIKANIEIAIKERQQAIEDAILGVQKTLTSIKERILDKQKEWADIREQIKLKQTERNSLFDNFNKEKEDFEQEKKKTAVEKQEAVKGKEANKIRTEAVSAGEVLLKDQRNQFETEKQEELNSLEDQRVVLETEMRALDIRKVNLDALNAQIQAGLKDYARVKVEALELQTISKIDETKKREFEEACRSLNIQIEQNKTLHTELAEKDAALNVKSGALAYRGANIRKREKLVKQAEKHIKEVQNASDKSNAGN